MDLNISVFQEPRGVMRILHFVFSICAFATITGYSGYIKYSCPDNQSASDEYSYPFQFVFTRPFNVSGSICQIFTTGDFSSDAKFFVATGVLAMLYSIAIIFVYMKFDELYRTNNKIPLYDFLFTVVFGVLWLSSSAAWANGLTGLKTVTTNPKISESCSNCTTSTSNFSTLNISVIFGFLNFFLWAADLWFLYKETAWFQGRQPNPSEGA
ncbi:synaptophysin-like [Anoplophora glabripennis]|uniref:synaptophysin-like n=1 Tax=Anoplophora glabripennis TaxID=217634 RepID=UPI0008759A7C|nr:synaptophysin-like [Anoplophora glabripennis]